MNKERNVASPDYQVCPVCSKGEIVDRQAVPGSSGEGVEFIPLKKECSNLACSSHFKKGW